MYHAPNLPAEKHCFYDKHTDFFKAPPANLVALEQKTHSSIAVFVDRPSIREIVADGAVATNPGLLLSVRTADCVPVLFADYKHGVIGVSHGGWRGALHGILENTVRLMLGHGAKKEDIVAAIGPCLQKSHFESRQDMYGQFIAKDAGFARYFTQKNNERYLFDSERFAFDRIKGCGVENISRSRINTYTSQDLNSYRRDCHQGKSGTVSQFSAIRL